MPGATLARQASVDSAYDADSSSDPEPPDRQFCAGYLRAKWGMHPSRIFAGRSGRVAVEYASFESAEFLEVLATEASECA